MNRRSFIVAVGAGAAAGASIASAAGRDLQAKAMVSTYAANMPAFAASAPGDALQIRRDQERGYDRHAVEILAGNGERLGHLPPIHSRIIESLLAAGCTATAWVEEARVAPRPAMRIGLALAPSQRGEG
jgi:predicted Zn-dependent protease